MTPKVLIINSNIESKCHIGPHLRKAAFRVVEAEWESGAMKLLANSDFDVVILWLQGLGQEGLTLIRIIQGISPTTRIITLNSPQKMNLSIEAMRLGVYDDFLIPFELDALIASVRRACRERAG